MKTTTTTLLAALMLVISCKKESSTIQSTGITDESNSQALSTGSNEPGIYASIEIGGRKVMKKNLNVTHYRNGDLIPQVKDPVKWHKLTTGAWCWYNNDPANGAIYGKLYNWYAVNDPRGLAPEGWHIPSDEEATTLISSLGNNAGGKMKSTGTIEAGTGLWWAPNYGATNSSGFTGLPGGFRDEWANFYQVIGGYGYWWSSTEDDATYAWFRLLYWDGSGVDRFRNNKGSAMSVRCLKD